jgi:hypothetical protein
MGWQAEAENTVLYNYGDKKYCNKLDQLASIISGSVGVELKGLNKKKSFLINRRSFVG